jgi:hypothetical protein
MGDVRPIQTRYKGCHFRSRLEARWAVFFDALGVPWEYEKEGYELPGGRYLPDFWLPTFSGGMFAEVKPPGGDFSQARELSREMHATVWLCEGTPDVRAYWISDWDQDRHFEISGIPNADQAEGHNRMFWQPGYENLDLTIPAAYRDCLGDTFLRAVAAARSARFEFGQEGPT